MRHQRVLVDFFFFPLATSLIDVLAVSSFFRLSGLGSRDEGLEARKREEREPTVDCKDLRLLASGSRGAEVGPGTLAVVLVDEVEVEFECARLVPLPDDSPECRPLVYGREEVEAADMGERSSGVKEGVLVSGLWSSEAFKAGIRGIEIWDGLGVGGLLYTPFPWKAWGVEYGG